MTKGSGRTFLGETRQVLPHVGRHASPRVLVYMCPFSSETARIPRATPAKVRGGRVGTPHPSAAYPSDAHLTPASGSPTGAREDPSPTATEALLRLSNPRPVAPQQPHARTPRGKVQIHQNHFHQKNFFIKIHFHQKTLPSKTNFIKKPPSSKCHFHQNATFIKNHFHQKPFSSKTIFIKNHFHQKPISSKTNFIRALPVRGTHHPSKNNIVRVCVKASRAEGPRRLHTNTACAHLLEGRQCSAERPAEGPKVGV